MHWAKRMAKMRMLAALPLLLLLWFESGCRAQQPWELWENYAAKFVDSQGRVIDRNAQDRTTSEGQAYAMFFALVAGDRARFDKILRWTEENMAGGDMTLRLPAWDWGKNAEGQWKVLDPNPAADADLWMAYSLIEGGRLWKDSRYEKLGAVMASRIAQTEVILAPGLGTTLAPGPQGFHPSPSSWVLNASYLPPPLLTYFSKSMPQGPWGSILDSMPLLLQKGSASGFAMDWTLVADGAVRPSLTPTELASGKNEGVPIGAYEAIRVYLWLGISDPNTPGLRAMVAPVSGMANYMRTNVTPPQKVDAMGKIVSADAPVGFSAALIPYLSMVGMKQQAKTQMDRLVATKDPGNGLYGKGDYYDQNLALFAMGWSEARFRFDKEGRLKLKWK